MVLGHRDLLAATLAREPGAVTAEAAELAILGLIVKLASMKRLRALAESRGYNTTGLTPSASAARTLEPESGIGSETVRRFLARHTGIVEGRGTARGLRNLRASFSKTVLVGDEKQLGAVEAGKPFEQLRQAGMQTAVMDEILRQRDMDLSEAVRAGLAGEVRTAFEKLGDRIAQVEREDTNQRADPWTDRRKFARGCPPRMDREPVTVVQ